jgi:hypothetical protein
MLRPFKVEISFGSPLVILTPDLTVPESMVVITATCDGFTATAKGPAMAYTLPADKQVTLQVEFLDAKGNHATIDGDPVWASSDDAVATAAAAPGNPFLAQLLPVAPGNCQVTCEADADLGDGVREVLCTMDVTVVGGEAVIGTITPAGDAAPISPGGPG